jgi:hypothetical protein
MPAVAASAPNPIAVDPDIIRTGRYRALIIDIRRLVGHIAIHGTTSGGYTPSYSNDHEYLFHNESINFQRSYAVGCASCHNFYFICDYSGSRFSKPVPTAPGLIIIPEIAF